MKTLTSMTNSVIALSLLFSSAIWAGHSHLHQQVSDLDIYLVVIPAEMHIGHPREHFESHMHDGNQETARFHIIVSVFNKHTGRKEPDVIINANIIAGNYIGPVKKLEPMILEGESSYGNYFGFPVATAVQISLTLKSAKSEEILNVVFPWGKS